MLFTDPAFVAADPAAVAKYLTDAGLTNVQATTGADGLTVTAAEGDASVAAALYLPDARTFQRLPPSILDHIQHMRDYRTAVRLGQAVTNAQTTHVIADIIDALTYLNSRVTGD